MQLLLAQNTPVGVDAEFGVKHVEQVGVHHHLDQLLAEVVGFGPAQKPLAHQLTNGFVHIARPFYQAQSRH